MATQTVPDQAFVASVRRAVDPTQQRLLFAVLVLGAMIALCAPFFVDLIARDAPKAVNGEISYRDWGSLDAPAEIGGEWRLVWRDGGTTRPGSSLPIAVPGNWSGYKLADQTTLPATGVASFTLTLRDLPPGKYTLHVPTIFGASRIFVDEQLASSRGRMGPNALSARSTARSHEVTFAATGAPVKLRVDIASFHHRDTGFVDAPILGRTAAMQKWIALEWTKDLLFHAALLVLAANTAIAYLFRRQDRASLYLSLAAITCLPAAAILSHDNLLLLTLPDIGFRAMLAMQYFGAELGVMFFLAYAHALFPRESPRTLFWCVEALIAAFALSQGIAIALGDTMTASLIAIAWPIISGLAFVGIIVIVLRAAFQRREGALVFLIGIFVFAVMFLNAIIAYSGLIAPQYLFSTASLPLGMLVLLFSHFIVIAERWSLAIVTGERTNSDLRELIDVNAAITSEMRLDALLARIVEATSRILGADRSSLLIHDPKTGELWSLVAEGMATREIRIGSTVGLAGHAFTSGEVLNIADAYTDARFNRGLDIETGYRTTSILTMPIAARDGTRIGVMQALNRRDGQAFNDADVQRMSAFAAQAAIAIQNATLFSEVVTSRNYNESILRSMSSGVVTLDRDAEIAKLNEAACRILNLPATGIEGQDARAMLGRSNPWLLEEIDSVGATGEPKLLLDIDVQTGTDETVSANLSIVPLIGETEPVGLLILIEDISEGKRLQGAMRRFMTQKVVDQVLERGNELLFGTACEASVLFADIRNFTAMAEALSARETVDMLNEAFTEFFEAVAASDGVLDKFIGDAIMAVYGAPLTSGRDPENAVESGVNMLNMLDVLNQRRAARALPPMRIGIGVSTGEVVAGTIGSPKRMDYTVIGDSVNLAARLQDLTKAYGVEMLICETTAAAVAKSQRLREIDLILVRGRQRPAKIFEVAPRAAADPAAFVALCAAYQCGRDCLTRRDWAGAVAAFEASVAIAPKDKPSQLMLERAKTLVDAPPAENWDGVWRGAAHG